MPIYSVFSFTDTINSLICLGGLLVKLSWISFVIGNEDPFQLLMYSVSSLVAGGAGILIMVEIGGTNPIQTLLDDSVIALDHSPHQNHNHLNGEGVLLSLSTCPLVC